MCALTEGKMAVGRARDVEALGLIEGGWVVVARGIEKADFCSFRDVVTAKVCVLGGVAVEKL